MDGLRSLSDSPSLKFPLKFSASHESEFPWIRSSLDQDGGRNIERSGPDQGTGPALKGAFALRNFFSEVHGTETTLRLVCVPMNDDTRTIKLEKAVFVDVLSRIGAGSWAAHLISTSTYGFHQLGNLNDDGSANYFLGTSFAWYIWTTTYHRGSNFFSTDCLVLSPYFESSSLPTSTARHSPAQVGPMRLIECAAAFNAVSSSALYLPLVLCAFTLGWVENNVLEGRLDARIIEARTGHGGWRSSHFQEKRESIPVLTSRLALVSNFVSDAAKHTSIIKSTVDSMSDMLSEMGQIGSEEVRYANLSILVVAKILRCQASSAGKQCEYLQSRVRNQMSILFAFLTHEDSKINIEVAHANRTLAEATRRDSSSMKTIAVLGMVYLPATFLATLFSMPLFAERSGHNTLEMYWGITVALTAATFGLWAVLTQRGQIRSLCKWARAEGLPFEGKEMV
ncbi:hypothetical protein QBC34DRAFT_304964 [Podospora aff. communis PSN243]|uniref:Transporter n=1 Tax=Podospora aff. communis PSN243 TaxID=3040156 RepID=A0AAV9GGT0_9PEZI|nr:hypothetical protein QBC34DRAFT_304964 [Podospora aff. communis PSN243]